MTTDLCHYRHRPVAFIARYIAQRLTAHAAIRFSVVGAVSCSIGVQYGVKRLVDVLAQEPKSLASPWASYLVLVALIVGDNLLWRVGGWIASSTFVKVTGDLRSELFRDLTGHAPAYFADRMPGMLTSRITATSNAVSGVVMVALSLCAAVAARCASFIEEMPKGLDTIVGDRGVKLSGGQRQRIAIARAFLKNAPLLIFDEATSALDSESEEAIRDAMERLMTGRTVIMIAHRLTTLRNFDRIIVLSGGQVIEDGSPDDLIGANGLYSGLVKCEIDRLARKAA